MKKDTGKPPRGFQFHGPTIIHQGRSFDFTTEAVTLPNGRRVTLDSIQHPGASAIVALTEAWEVVLLRQYRHAVGDYIWEIPAGTLEGQEAPLVCARRELTEESGYRAACWDSLGHLWPAPGYSDEKIFLYLARDLTPAVQSLDEDELLEVHLTPWREAIEMAHSGEIEDTIAISGLFRARRLIQPQSRGRADRGIR